MSRSVKLDTEDVREAQARAQEPATEDVRRIIGGRWPIATAPGQERADDNERNDHG